MTEAGAAGRAQAAEGDDPSAAVEEPTTIEEEEGGEAQDLHAPEIRVLGPVEVTGVDSTGHGPRMAQLAAPLLFRPGRSADVLCADMDPVSPWSTSTLNARMQGLRSCLGSDSSGNLYVPRRKTGEDPYRLAPSVRCDWARFLRLVERALPLGPAGLGNLERALGLVRGKPFGGKPLPWAEPLQQEMTTRIIDVARTAATHRTPTGPHDDLAAARQAVAAGIQPDPIPPATQGETAVTSQDADTEPAATDAPAKASSTGSEPSLSAPALSTHAHGQHLGPSAAISKRVLPYPAAIHPPVNNNAAWQSSYRRPGRTQPHPSPTTSSPPPAAEPLPHTGPTRPHRVRRHKTRAPLAGPTARERRS